jgi:hypothetical protein
VSATKNCSGTSNRLSSFIGIKMFRTTVLMSPALNVRTELGDVKSLLSAVVPTAATLKNENKEI